MSRNLEKLFQIEGKIIVVTGAAGLLGSKYIEAIVAYGGIPILIDLKQKKLDNLVNQIKEKYNKEVYGFKVDITKEEEVVSNVEKVISLYGKIDGLINNAANNPKDKNNINDLSRLENFPLDDWNQDIKIGLTGAFICSKHFGKKISENPKGGVIINISSDLGLIAPDQRLYKQDQLQPDQQPAKPVSYSVVKTGIIGLTRFLATYWVDEGVRCNAICPGGVKTNLDEALIKRVEKLIPLDRMAESDEYQGALIFLLSDASSYMTGSTLVIDGGRTIW